MVAGGADRKPQEFFCLFIFVLIYSLHFFKNDFRLPREYAWKIQKVVTEKINVCDLAFVVLK